jgi:hypothetical protein
MTDERFGEQIRELMQELDPVPEVPRDEMWGAIAAARRFRRPARRPWFRWSAWSSSLAATLVLGVAIGRQWSPAPSGDTSGLPAAPALQNVALRTPPSVPAGAADYLQATAALLASFPQTADAERSREAADWARQLLLDTRLLIDSSANDNVELARLLQDLELVLAQIASLPAQHNQQEILLIQDGIRQNKVLTRVKLAAGAALTIGDD